MNHAKHALAVLLLVLLSSSCTSGNVRVLSASGSAAFAKRQAAPEHVHLVFWNNLFPTVDANNPDKSKQDFYIYQAIRRFETLHPNISIDLQTAPGDISQITKFQAASIAANGPDLATLWTGNYVLGLKDYLEPVNSYFTKSEMERINGWSGVAEGFDTVHGKIYGVPSSSDGIVFFFYSKKAMARAGVDNPERYMVNIDQFMNLLDKLKPTGTIPLAMDNNTYLFHLFDYWIAQTLTLEGLNGLVHGDGHNFSDPQIINIVRSWARLGTDGYVEPEAPSYDDRQATKMLISGKAAMTTGGPWNVSDLERGMGADLGFVRIPDFSENAPITKGGIGGAGNGWVVTKYSKHKEEAFEFIKFIMNKEEQEKQFQMKPSTITNVTDVKFSDFTNDPILLRMQKMSLQPNDIFWPDNIYPYELSSEMASIGPLAFSGKMSPEEFCQKLDQKRDEILRDSNTTR